MDNERIREAVRCLALAVSPAFSRRCRVPCLIVAVGNPPYLNCPFR